MAGVSAVAGVCAVAGVSSVFCWEEDGTPVECYCFFTIVPWTTPETTKI